MRFLLPRFLQGAIVVLAVSLLTFALLSAAGGDAASALREDSRLGAATLAQVRSVYGLDQPWPVRYGRWVGGVVRGDLGVSLKYQVPVSYLLKPRLARTAALALVALVLALLIAGAIGGTAARRSGGWADKLCDAFILLASAVPRIALALGVLALLAVMGWGGLGARTTEAATLFGSQIIAPAIVLALPLAAVLAAQVREGLRTALAADFVRVARSKGLSESAIMRRHALRAALNPVITLSGTAWGQLLSGSVIVETVFNWQGLGAGAVEAVTSRDVPLLLSIVLLTTLCVIGGNLLADIGLVLNDPRLRGK